MAESYDTVVAVDCTFVTCDIVPALDPDDRAAVRELRARDVTVSTAVWSDPAVDWAAARLCVVRSTWDYHLRYEQFAGWIERTAAQTTLRNAPHLLRWNAHKSYLRDLERSGVPIVPTVWARRGERLALAAALHERGWRDVVLKPAYGAAAYDVALVREDHALQTAGQARLDRMLQAHDVLIQPYLKSVVSYGERALIFLSGRFSHAVVKKPFDQTLVVGHQPSLVVEPTRDELVVAGRALAAVPGEPLYARVDLLVDDGLEPRVSEVELIEPGLYLGLCKSAPAAFADAVICELERR